MDDGVRARLALAIKRHGPGVVDEREKCRGLLSDCCGELRSEFNALFGALEEEVPASLLAPPQIPYSLVILNLIKRLEDNRNMSEEKARWAVESWASALGQVVKGTFPTPPKGLVAVPGDGRVTLAWSASSGATRYDVRRSTTGGGPYTTIGSATSNNYTDGGLTNGTAYYYIVRAVNAGGESEHSNQVSVTPDAAERNRKMGWKIAAAMVSAVFVWVVWHFVSPKPLEITSVKFYESGTQIFVTRAFRTHFPKDSTKHISAEISFSRKASEDMDLESVWHKPDGTLFREKYQLKSGQDTATGRSDCCDDAGHWLAGDYEVDFPSRENTTSIKLVVGPSTVPQIKSVSFFESGNGFTEAGPYRDTFPKDSTRYVNFAAVFSAEASEDLNLETVWHKPNGSTSRSEAQLKRGQNRIRSGHGWDEKGNWLVGHHTVEFLLGGTKFSSVVQTYVGSGEFDIDARLTTQSTIPPLIIPPVTPLHYYGIPSLRANVQPIQFFKTTNEHFTEPTNRVLTDHFQSSDKCVGWQLPIEYDSSFRLLSAPQNFSIDAFWYLDRNRREFHRHTTNWVHSSSEAGQVILYPDVWCRDDAWPRDTYIIILLIDGQQVNSGRVRMD